jgi:hypothetical protein
MAIGYVDFYNLGINWTPSWKILIEQDISLELSVMLTVGLDFP